MIDWVCVLLDGVGVFYWCTTYELVYTSVEVAVACGVSLHSGAKVLVFKVGDRFLLVVLLVDLSFDSVALRMVFGICKIRFVSKEELFEIIGFMFGVVLLFGSLFGLEIVCDTGLVDNDFINFNVGSYIELL